MTLRAKDNKKISCDEAVRTDEATSLETLIRRWARSLTDAIVAEELEVALGRCRIGTCGPGVPGLPAWEPRADVDDKSGGDHVRAACPRPDGRRHDRGVAERAGAAVSAPERARR